GADDALVQARTGQLLIHRPLELAELAPVASRQAPGQGRPRDSVDGQDDARLGIRVDASPQVTEQLFLVGPEAAQGENLGQVTGHSLPALLGVRDRVHFRRRLEARPVRSNAHDWTPSPKSQRRTCSATALSLPSSIRSRYTAAIDASAWPMT